MGEISEIKVKLSQKPTYFVFLYKLYLSQTLKIKNILLNIESINF